MPSIAIVGTQGCGKTVFITTLAIRLSTLDAQGVFLNPVGGKTLKYIEDNWRILNNHEWPASTTPGTSFTMEWKLKVGNATEYDLRLIDAAGQDLRQMFADDSIVSQDTLPKSLWPLANYCLTADIVMFMMNLKDFIGEGNDEMRVANQSALKSAMDHLRKDGHQCCLLFTQADQFQNYVHAHGGWTEIIKKHLKYVWGAHLAHGEIWSCAVSAVKDTKIVVQGDGVTRRVPVPGFQSTNLEKVVGWLTKAAHNTDEAKRIKEQAATDAVRAEEARKSREQEAIRAKARNRKWLVVASIIFAIIFLITATGIGIGFYFVSNARAKENIFNILRANENANVAPWQDYNSQYNDRTIEIGNYIDVLQRLSLEDCPSDFQNAFRAFIGALKRYHAARVKQKHDWFKSEPSSDEMIASWRVVKDIARAYGIKFQ
jgi:hypothetical protein